MAPQTTEFGAKVALLGGLVVLTPLRYLFDRSLTREEAPSSPLAMLATVPPGRGKGRLFSRGAVVGSALVLVATAIVAAGAPARGSGSGSGSGSAGVAPVVEVEVDPATLPIATASAEAMALNGEVDPDALALMLAENLEIEAMAMLRSDTSLLRAADDGERLVEMERIVEVAATTGQLVVLEHDFDSLHLEVVFTDGPQGGASLAFVAEGTVDEVTFDVSGAELGRVTNSLSSTFVVGKGTGERWLILSEVEP
jgi:hypothetical protein